ncbi:copper homeostasis membrane protein CopD [Pseudomonas gingeri]|uniref:Copper resistance protein D n=1 Tax=Pseudomonas gingeri TaxID=117681 RepID=A0A7Y8CMQ7_9PSED|nr:copper homeostasis membrane protein CopD [Pseudomonas gingeri]NWB29543.1 copper homeostasis membrane protein CopD [Pseudomonas gingeri]NWC36456.1 copper homeostasis membrane protein CopD [Pseudomonas gingeri]NWD05317.1 copper homeostasis membrane protein CopD [Pseudomonas gingeri]NWE31852.1 copper homeostasis membrane protein CopD [Pseudomonas gingeri]NWE59712.1 copper homeostasis membrane protein CopD [Pseudomonas gingeri]
MSDFINMALRFTLYTDLMMLFGLALFGLYSLRGRERRSGVVLHFESLLTGSAAIGIVASIAALVVLAQSMSAASSWIELHPHIEMILTETEVGLSWIIRVSSLILVMAAAAQNKRSPTASLWIVTLGGGIALATLAWTGHGAMDDGRRRIWHFATDIFHLLAAGGWLGALVAFGLLVRLKKVQARQSVGILARALTGFESAGAVIVGIIIVTGVVNYLFIVGPNLDGITDSTYGLLLFLKLALFGAMLGLAALNRFHLGPFLERSLANGDYTVAANTLRRSMVAELGLAIVIICLVAWLGTLSPEMDRGESQTQSAR